MEKAFQAVGELGSYQRKVILICSMTIYTIFYPLLYAYMSKPPVILCPSADNPEAFDECTFSTSVCESKNFIIDEKKSLDNWALKYHLYCGREYYLPIMSTMFFSGSVIGNYVLGTFPDRYGRKRIFQIIMGVSCFLHLNLLFPLGPMHIIIVMFICGLSTFAGSMAFFIVSEYLPGRITGLVLALVNSLYPITGMILGFYFLSINNYKILLSFTFFTHAYVTYVAFAYFTESPRWLKTMGREEECVETFRTIARYNGREKEWEEFLSNNRENFLNEDMNSSSKASAKNYNIIQIFLFKSQRRNLLILSYIWFIGAFIFFGVVLNLSLMNGNFFSNILLTFAGEIVGQTVTGYLIGKYGRVIVLRINVFMGGSFFFLFIISNGAVSSILLFLAMGSNASVFAVISVLSPETFPTTIRSTVCGFLVLVGRLSPITVPPLTSIIGRKIDFLFALCPFITFCLTFYLKETLGQELPSDIPEEQVSTMKESFLNNGI